MSEVTEWVKATGQSEEIVAALQSAGFDCLKTVASLTEEELERFLKIGQPGKRRKLKLEIDKLNASESLQSFVLTIRKPKCAKGHCLGYSQGSSG